MSFPTPFVVQHHAAVIVTEDDLGNNSVIFDAPVDQKVISIAPAVVEQLGPYASRQITDVDLYVPHGFMPGLQDRITLPDGGLFEVVSVEDYSYGFHLWPAAGVAKLRRVTG